VHWHPLGTIYSSPGFCDERLHLFLASGLVPEQAATGEDEIREVKRLTIPEVERAIADGTLVDAKSIAAYTRATLQGVLGGLSA
jgi:ADP-ribose pyrophosphatase